ncbi:MAG: FadR family transcriptional regulator [Thermomicrobiales bacterium]|nr:FadR family transcriptional regulator [Thermomicrobiales bacterium]
MSERLTGIEPIQREPLATQIARRLVDYLLSGQVAPGERMPSERQLAQAFGVGRSAMREAIKSLSLIGLVEVRHGDGTYLRKTDSSLLPQVIEWGLLLGEPRTRDLVEARQKIEVAIAGMAAERRRDDDLAALRDCLERMRRIADQDGPAAEFVEADVDFHVRLAEAADNTALRDVIGGIQALLRVWIGRVIMAGAAESSYQEHIPIYEAVACGDAAAAQLAMEAHMVSAAARLERALMASRAAQPLAANNAAPSSAAAEP